MPLTTQHICVSTGTALKGNLVRLGHFNWHAAVLSHCAAPVALGVSIMLPGRSQPVSRKISQWRAYRRMDRKEARMTDDPGNSSQNAMIHPAQGLRAAGEVCILGRWKYFEKENKNYENRNPKPAHCAGTFRCHQPRRRPGYGVHLSRSAQCRHERGKRQIRSGLFIV